MHCKEALFSIASAIGKPLRIDQATTSLVRPSVARVLVEYDVTQPPLQRIRIDVGDSGFWQSVILRKSQCIVLLANTLAIPLRRVTWPIRDSVPSGPMGISRLE